MIKNFKRLKLFGLVGLVIAIDQVLKWLITELGGQKGWYLIKNQLGIKLYFNEGAAFGIDLGTFLIYFISIFLIVYLLARAFRNFEKEWIGTGLVVGGAISNIIDRIFQGHVVDYIEIWIWPVFNLADVAIVAGIIYLGLKILKEK